MSTLKTSGKTFAHHSILTLTALLVLALCLPPGALAQGLDLSVTANYDPIWNDSGSGSDQDGSLWRPIPDIGWYRVGHHIKQGYSAPNTPSMVVRSDDPALLAHPRDYALIWTDSGSGGDLDGSMWHPICPDGFAALGDVGVAGYGKPALDEVVCVRLSELTQAEPGNPIWNDSGSGADGNFSAWGVRYSGEAQSIGLFYGSNTYARPSAAIFFAVR